MSNINHSKEWQLLQKLGKILLREKGSNSLFRANEERARVLLPKRQTGTPF